MSAVETIRARLLEMQDPGYQTGLPDFSTEIAAQHSA